ncbi:hypothetical protein HNQ56_001745 [Anaerotaenia torta]|uniref:glycosyl hydrolase n=1 Tax=Anaerotaenia torta TaxID=433293 RepID=UPI003D2190AF
MNKKRVVYILVFILTITLFAACSKKGKTEQPVTDDTESKQSAEVKEEGKEEEKEDKKEIVYQEDEVIGIKNLAAGKAVTVSSTESGERLGKYAVDQNEKTRFSSAYEDNQYLIIDLGEEITFHYIMLLWEAAFAKDYDILGSSDNQNWDILYQKTDFKGGNEVIELNEAKARYVKLDMKTRATIYGFSLYEVGIYAEKPELPVDEDAVNEEIHAKAKSQIIPSGITEEIGVLDFLQQISGRQTLLSIHNREPNAEPTKQTDRIWARTGVYPAMWSGDFLFSADDVANRWKMIEECKNQWEQGAIVQLMLHVTAPNQPEVGPWKGGVLAELTEEEWSSLITDGGEMNKLWKQRLDIYYEYFQYLEDHNVTVLFRPFHEMNQSVFWWGGRPGENGTGALFCITRDYLEKEKGLTNLIWVWNMQDLDYSWADYNPGDQYWEIFSVDFYNGDGFTQRKYDLALSIAGDKPMGIGECDALPTPQQLVRQNRWAFCMSWAELTFEKNSSEAIRNLYWAENTLVREELPKLK